jgi:hypothetical protein
MTVSSVAGHRSMYAGLAVSAVCLSLLWSWAVPTVMGRTTFALLAIFLLGGATVALMTWRNAQATDSVAQLLHATELAPGATSPPDGSPRKVSS